jgi:membrane fusion protein (multidrug efflux system)
MTAPHPTQEDTARIHAVEDAEPAAAAAAPGGVPGGGRRRAARIAGAAMTAAALAAVAVHLYLTRGDESTDAAQVEADVVPIAPRVAGAVLRVHVNDNQLVEKGDLLLEIDPADHAARVRQAEADLATAGAQAAAADAQILVARAAVARAEADGRKGSADLARARRLRAADALPQAQLDTVQAAGDSADAGIAAARAQLAAARASAELAHARARGAEAALELARLQLSYTKVLAPRDGELSRLAAREGQLVAAAQPVAQLVPLETYLVANFKETQIGAMAPGQTAEIEIDGYGGTKLEGRVESISGGTGARFSLLPPDNASGNFVKVTERVPVRIAWVKVPEGIRLRAGLSAEVTVHTR